MLRNQPLRAAASPSASASRAERAPDATCWATTPATTASRTRTTCAARWRACSYPATCSRSTLRKRRRYVLGCLVQDVFGIRSRKWNLSSIEDEKTRHGDGVSAVSNSRLLSLEVYGRVC